MGIKGLLKHLDSIQVDTHVSDFNGQVCGIDGYVWLHRAVFPNATELVMSKGNLAKEAIAEEKVAHQVIKYAESIMSCGVDLYMVFDGRSTEAKRQEESTRRGSRAKNLEQGHGMYRAGNTDLAHKRFAASVDVTPRMAARVCRLLKQRNIPFVVAPYEADAQLSYLFHTGQVQFCISEDSDLLTHGVHTVLYKLDFRNLIGKVIHLHRDATKVSGVLSPIMNLGMDSEVAQRRFIAMCVLFGCDYGPTTIPKAGPKKVVDLLNRLNKKDEEGFSDPVKIVNIARFLGLDVHPEFVMHYEKAIFCFNHHTVFNTTDRCLEPQRKIKSERPSWADDVAGRILDKEIARKIAKAEIDPFTFEPFDFGDELVEEIMQAKENEGKMDNAPRIQDGMAMLLVAPQWKKTVTARREPKRLVILPSKNQPTIDQFFKKIPKKKGEEEEVLVLPPTEEDVGTYRSRNNGIEVVLPLGDGPKTESPGQVATTTSTSSERRDPMLTNLPRFAQQPPNAHAHAACNAHITTAAAVKDPFEAFTFSSRSSSTTSGPSAYDDSMPLADGPTISTTSVPTDPPPNDHGATGKIHIEEGGGGPSTKRRNKKRENPYRTNVHEHECNDGLRPHEGDREYAMAASSAANDELFKSFYLHPSTAPHSVEGLVKDDDDDDGPIKRTGVVLEESSTSGKEERKYNITSAILGSKRPKPNDDQKGPHMTTTSSILGSKPLQAPEAKENPYRIATTIPNHDDSNEEDDSTESAPCPLGRAHEEGTKKKVDQNVRSMMCQNGHMMKSEKEGKGGYSSGMRKENPYRITDDADAIDDADADATPIPDDDDMVTDEPQNRCTTRSGEKSITTQSPNASLGSCETQHITPPPSGPVGSSETQHITPPPKQRRRSVVASKPAIILPYRSSKKEGRRKSLGQSIHSPTTWRTENSGVENAKTNTIDGTKSPYSSGSSSGIPFGETDTTTPVVTLAENFFSQFAFSEGAETGTTSTSNSTICSSSGGKGTPSTETPEKGDKNRGSIGSSGNVRKGGRGGKKGTTSTETGPTKLSMSSTHGAKNAHSLCGEKNGKQSGRKRAAERSSSVNSRDDVHVNSSTSCARISTTIQQEGEGGRRRSLRKRSERTDVSPENRKRARRSVTDGNDINVISDRNDDASSTHDVRVRSAAGKGRGKGKKALSTTTKPTRTSPKDIITRSEGKNRDIAESEGKNRDIAESEAQSQQEDGSTTGESVRDSPPTPSEETPGVDPFAKFFFNKANWQAA